MTDFYIKIKQGVKNEGKYNTVATLSWYYLFSYCEQEYCIYIIV